MCSLHNPDTVFRLSNMRCFVNSKCSTAAEMDDRAREKWAEKWGTAVPLSVREAGLPLPSSTMSPGKRPTSVYQVAS